MIAIKDMKEAPSGCDRCELFHVCKHRDIYNENYKPDDCPLVEIEPLSDTEMRIFLSAINREKTICKQIDDEKVDDGLIIKLVPIVNSIKRKVKKTLWDI